MSDVQNPTAVRPRWLPYRVKKPFSPGALALLLAGVVVIFVVGGLLSMVTGTALGGLAFAVGYPALYARFIASTSALGVYRPVLVIGGRRVKWDIVDEISMAGPAPDGRTDFAARLNERWARRDGRAVPSADAQGFHLRSSTTRAFELDALRSSLARSAPSHVKLTGF